MRTPLMIQTIIVMERLLKREHDISSMTPWWHQGADRFSLSHASVNKTRRGYWKLIGGLFFCIVFAFFFGFWLLAFGFWLLAPSVSGFWLVFAAFWSQNLWFACYLLQFGANLHAHLAFGFWLWLHLTLGFWFLVFVVFLALVSLGFWLLAALLLNVCVVL